ncbi:hypothetical protein ACLKA6_010757 [Drosophila palustris]
MAKVIRSVFLTWLQLLLVGISLLEQVSANVVLQAIRLRDQGNILISPFLLAEGLTQLYLGAEGQTAEELKFVIPSLTGNNETDFYEYIKEDRSNILSNESSALKFGSAVFVAKDVNILPDYEQSIRQIFNTEVKKVAFGNPSTVSEINDWVADQTDNAIQDIVAETTDDTKIMLVSAMYFKGKWQQPFDASKTKKMPFFKHNGALTEIIMVDFMTTIGIYNCAFIKDLDADAIALPYADSDISLVIIKPRKTNGIEELIAGLNSIQIHEIFNDNSMEKLDLELPKFKLEYNVDLKQELQGIGIQELFDSANLKSMTDFASPLYVSEVVQKVFIAVDEEGTTASAAQEINVLQRMAIRKFTVNQPFVFYIKDNKRIYFTGMIFSPL